MEKSWHLKLKSYDTYHVFLNDMECSIITGEACALGMRKLCSVTPEVLDIYIRYTGIKILPNTQHLFDDGMYRVFLTSEIIEDLVIIFLLTRHEQVCHIVPDPDTKDSGFVRYPYLLAGSLIDTFEFTRDPAHNFTTYKPLEEPPYLNTEHRAWMVKRYYSYNKDQPRRGINNVSAFTGLSIS